MTPIFPLALVQTAIPLIGGSEILALSAKGWMAPGEAFNPQAKCQETEVHNHWLVCLVYLFLLIHLRGLFRWEMIARCFLWIIGWTFLARGLGSAQKRFGFHSVAQSISSK